MMPIAHISAVVTTAVIGDLLPAMARPASIPPSYEGG